MKHEILDCLRYMYDAYVVKVKGSLIQDSNVQIQLHMHYMDHSQLLGNVQVSRSASLHDYHRSKSGIEMLLVWFHNDLGE